MKHITFTIMLLTIIFSMAINSKVTAQMQVKAAPLDAQLRKQTVEKLAKMLDDNYVFAETAKKMREFINSQLQNGAYDNITDPAEFSNKLTDDLRSISHDKHL